MSKSRAVLSHLLPSILVMAVIGGLLLFAWYPYPFQQFRDSDKFLLLLIITAGFAGPGLTLLIYRKGKRGLISDLIIIVLIQMAAIAWGTHTLYQNRPYFMVFTVDRFEVLSIQDVDTSSITDAKFLNKPRVGPVLLYANMPTDEHRFQKLLHEVMFEGKPDLQFRPEFWSLYSTSQHRALKTAQPLTKLRDARPQSVKAIDKWVQFYGIDIEQLKFVPAKLKNGHFATILDAHSGVVLGALEIDPWVN